MSDKVARIIADVFNWQNTELYAYTLYLGRKQQIHKEAEVFSIRAFP